MATTAVGETVKTLQENDENGTNGNISKLEYSGLSETDLGITDVNKSISNEISQDFIEVLDEHGAPAPSAKAIKREINENNSFNDDDAPKVLTTLETVKKPIQPNDSEDIEICPIETEDDEYEEEPILLEVVNEDEENKECETSELATKTVTYRKMDIATLANDVRSKVQQTPNTNNSKPLSRNNDSIVTPNKPIPTPSAGTIEIPRELITSDVSVISPVIINHIKNPSANSDDLIAILEDDGDNGSVNTSVEHYELSLSSGNKNGEQKLALTAEEEREIAMEQIMSLPKKKKGRPKLNPSVKAAREMKSGKKTKNTLVNSLVSEWDENEVKHDDSTETEIVVEIRPQKKQAIIEPVQSTFRRTRIIKKKIIWDPDAPETAINYASLAHTSGAGPVKKHRKKRETEETEPEQSETIGDKSVVAEVTLPLAPPPKKKKTSEIDKLLGDEGAANMLNSLHQGNNNNNKIDGTSPGKISRAKAIKVEPCTVQNSTPLSVIKAKTTKVKEVKEPSPQKQSPNPNKKNATPKSVGAGKKRGPKTSESWDYIYNTRPDDCMIIRRRSNSSYSSTASLNRTSIDLPNTPFVGDFDGGDNEHESETQTKKRQRTNKDKNFEFVKPRAKKHGKSDNDTKYQSSFDEAKNSSVDGNNVFTNHKTIKNHIKSVEFDSNALPIKLENDNDKDYSTFTQISVCRFEHFSQITLQPDDTDSKSLLTLPMLKEIETALHSLENDKTTKLILLTSSAENFCGGVDYSSLVQSTTGEKRRISTLELIKKLHNFVQILAAFKKPLVVYVKGLISGLGVRILPLFDVVWAKSGASFSANSQDYGEIIEGIALLSATDKIDYNAKVKLLFLNEVMGVEEAKDCNIVTQVLKEGTTDQRILIECNELATKSSLAMETFRLIQQQTVLPKLKDALKIEQKQLLQHWNKSDFMDKIKSQL